MARLSLFRLDRLQPRPQSPRNAPRLPCLPDFPAAAQSGTADGAGHRRRSRKDRTRGMESRSIMSCRGRSSQSWRPGSTTSKPSRPVRTLPSPRRSLSGKSCSPAGGTVTGFCLPMDCRQWRGKTVCKNLQTRAGTSPDGSFAQRD